MRHDACKVRDNVIVSLDGTKDNELKDYTAFSALVMIQNLFLVHESTRGSQREELEEKL